MRTRFVLPVLALLLVAPAVVAAPTSARVDERHSLDPVVGAEGPFSAAVRPPTGGVSYGFLVDASFLDAADLALSWHASGPVGATLALTLLDSDGNVLGRAVGPSPLVLHVGGLPVAGALDYRIDPGCRDVAASASACVVGLQPYALTGTLTYEP